MRCLGGQGGVYTYGRTVHLNVAEFVQTQVFLYSISCGKISYQVFTNANGRPMLVPFPANFDRTARHIKKDCILKALISRTSRMQARKPIRASNAHAEACG